MIGTVKERVASLSQTVSKRALVWRGNCTTDAADRKQKETSVFFSELGARAAAGLKWRLFGRISISVEWENVIGYELSQAGQ